MKTSNWLVRAIAVSAVLTITFGFLAFSDSNGSTTTEAGELSSIERATLRIRERLRISGAPEAGSEAQSEPATGQDDGETTSRANGQAKDLAPISAERLEPLRNTSERFIRFADVASADLPTDQLLEAAQRHDNGGSPEGQFRIACEYSHFSYDDPIVYPGEPGRSHLHMFFGNTEASAFTTRESLTNSGGSTCNGFELNRSAYWTPALLDGKGNIIVPDTIIVYYKTKHTSTVIDMPQGLQMVAGNPAADSFEAGTRLHWACGPSGTAYNLTNRIPDCGGDVINAGIQFPNCWDGKNLQSSDFGSHLTFVDPESACPASHPKQLPQITILLYYPGTDSVDGWYLSSDDRDGFTGPPGGTLHADWWGGWRDDIVKLWTDNCLRNKRNCSYGQTGTLNQLASLNKLQRYEGENYLPLPE